MHFTLHQMKVFDAVARHLSFTRAAEALFLTQPAVSMQIKQVEAQAGLPLFEQIGKKIFLTDAGQEFARHSRAIMRQDHELRQVMAEMKGMTRGRLSIAVTSTANYITPRLLGNFCARHSNITVSLSVNNRETVLRQLEENDTELAIMGKPPEQHDLLAESFMENPLVVIAPPGHRLTEKQHIPLQSLHGEHFILRESGSGTRVAMERFLQEKGVVFSADMEMSSNEAVKQAVQAGLGLGIVSLQTITLELETKRLAVLDVQDLPIMRHWYLVHRQGKRLSVVGQAFKDFVLQEGRGILSEQR